MTDRRRRPRTAAASAATAVTAATLLAAALLASLALLGTGCTERPAEPVWDNPFDPSGPDGGDPWNLAAYYTSGKVIVTWTVPDVEGLVEIVVLRSPDGVTFTHEAGRTLPTVSSFQDTTYTPYAANYYRVYATDAYDNSTNPSRVAAARADTPPRLEIAGGAARTATRHVELSVEGAAQGDTLEVAANRLFTGSQLFPVVTTGAEQLVDWDLGAATANGQQRQVWVRVRPLRAGWPSAGDSIEVHFGTPDLQLTGRPQTVATVRQTVDFTAAGVTLARFAAAATAADARAALTGAAWVEPDSSVGALAYYTDDLLVPGAEATPQWLFGEFQCDFGFSGVDSLLVAPDDLAAADFQIDGGAATTTDPTVTLDSDAAATRMRFAETPDLSGVLWQPYAEAIEFTLSAGAGAKTIYGQYRNDWVDSPVVMRTIVFVQTR